MMSYEVSEVSFFARFAGKALAAYLCAKNASIEENPAWQYRDDDGHGHSAKP